MGTLRYYKFNTKLVTSKELYNFSKYDQPSRKNIVLWIAPPCSLGCLCAVWRYNPDQLLSSYSSPSEPQINIVLMEV
jgi:hypothetical protein